MATLLRAEGLVRRFGDRDVVSDAALALDEAESIALMGPSGSGKTTFLQMVGLLDRPSAGKVLMRHHDTWQDTWQCSEPVRAEMRLTWLGFVFQQNNLIDHLSAQENIALPAWRLLGSQKEAMARAEALLGQLGLASRKNARAAELSVGEAQRVAIARALINGPRLILADEPTGSLDGASARGVIDALLAGRDHGAALLVVTHDPEVAARADRTLLMRDGRLVS
jgi:ABC-type lipoprotein export system ATPase subunit